MRMTLAVVMLAGVVCGQDSSRAPIGPQYDANGRLIAYAYPDGTSDSYVYDSSWRLTKYTDRDGKISVFVYNADGSMTFVNPDGSIAPR
jgi:YD repeat-containing protein